MNGNRPRVQSRNKQDDVLSPGTVQHAQLNCTAKEDALCRPMSKDLKWFKVYFT